MLSTYVYLMAGSGTDRGFFGIANPYDDPGYFFNGIDYDASKNIYINGGRGPLNVASATQHVFKFSPSGVPLWTTRQEGSTPLAFPDNILVSKTTNEIFASGVPLGGRNQVFKYSTTGQTTWGSLNTFTANTLADRLYVYGLDFDPSSGHLWSAYAWTRSTGTITGGISNYNSSTGSHIKTHQIYGSSTTNEVYYDFKMDSNRNAYFGGVLELDVNEGRIGLVKANTIPTTPTIVWGKWYYGAKSVSTVDRISSIVLDPAQNIYATGRITTSNASSGNSEAFVFKINPSGTILWAKNFYSPVGPVLGESIDIDENQNVYVAGYARKLSNTNYDPFILKLSNTGTVLWQRLITSTNPAADQYGFSVKCSKDKFVLMCGTARTYTNSFAQYTQGLYLKLPDDGSGTGTYGNYAYTSTTFSSYTPTITTADVAMVVGPASTLTNQIFTGNSTALTPLQQTVTPI